MLSSDAEPAGLVVGHVYLHPQQRGREGLALRVGHQRERAAAAERFVQQEVERAEVGQLEALDAALDQHAEMLFDALGRHLAREQRVYLLAQSDEPDVGRVALVARARVRQLQKFDSHKVDKTAAASDVARELSDRLPVALLGRRRVFDEEVQLVRARVTRLAVKNGSVLAEGVPHVAQLLLRLSGLAMLLDRVANPTARELLRQLEAREAGDDVVLPRVVVKHINDEHGVTVAHERFYFPGAAPCPLSPSRWNPTTTSEWLMRPPAMSAGTLSSGTSRTRVCSVPWFKGSCLYSTSRARNVWIQLSCIAGFGRVLPSATTSRAS